jgi:hypothetical protein
MQFDVPVILPITRPPAPWEARTAPESVGMTLLQHRLSFERTSWLGEPALVQLRNRLIRGLPIVFGALRLIREHELVQAKPGEKT